MEPKKEDAREAADNTKVKNNPVKKLYLLLYNTVLACSWSLILLKALVHISEKKSHGGLYTEVDFLLKVAQTAAVLEVFHAFFGLVRSSVLVTLPQVSSRIFTLWVVLHPLVMKDEVAKDTIGFPLLLFAWSITEVIRYAYYATCILEITSDALIWCRYTFFIILYPIGVIGELVCLITSIPIARETQFLSISLPNPVNISFSFEYFSYFVMLMYVPGFGNLYGYMLGQRKKVLGKKKIL